MRAVQIPLQQGRKCFVILHTVTCGKRIAEHQNALDAMRFGEGQFRISNTKAIYREIAGKFGPDKLRSLLGRVAMVTIPIRHDAWICVRYQKEAQRQIHDHVAQSGRRHT
jgi:hypothetical protein